MRLKDFLVIEVGHAGVRELEERSEARNDRIAGLSQLLMEAQRIGMDGGDETLLSNRRRRRRSVVGANRGGAATRQ
jgi:hypothetical protein